MSDIPVIRSVHWLTGRSVLAHLTQMKIENDALDAAVRIAWENRAPGVPANPMEHYFQGFTYFLSQTSPKLAARYAATLKDHGLNEGVPAMMAHLFAMGDIPGKPLEKDTSEQLSMVLRYLRILSRLQCTNTPSEHEWLTFISDVDLEEPPMIIEDKDRWGQVFLKALQNPYKMIDK